MTEVKIIFISSPPNNPSDIKVLMEGGDFPKKELISISNDLKQIAENYFSYDPDWLSFELLSLKEVENHHIVSYLTLVPELTSNKKGEWKSLYQIDRDLFKNVEKISRQDRQFIL